MADLRDMTRCAPWRAALAVLLVQAGAAAAQGFHAPEGCTPYLTVQHLSCRVSNHWTCADAPGHRWRVDIGPNGPTFVSRIDAEAQWVESYDPLRPDEITRTVRPAPDAASFTTLVETGFDDFEFTQEYAGGARVTIRGSDTILDRDVEIDGVPLMLTEFSMTRADETGRVFERASGREYISVEYRRFFAGRGSWTDDEGETPYDRRPVEFVLPGEPGFFSNRPKYECQLLAQMTAPAPLAPAEGRP